MSLSFCKGFRSRSEAENIVLVAKVHFVGGHEGTWLSRFKSNTEGILISCPNWADSRGGGCMQCASLLLVDRVRQLFSNGLALAELSSKHRALCLLAPRGQTPRKGSCLWQNSKSLTLPASIPWLKAPPSLTLFFDVLGLFFSALLGSANLSTALPYPDLLIFKPRSLCTLSLCKTIDPFSIDTYSVAKKLHAQVETGCNHTCSGKPPPAPHTISWTNPIFDAHLPPASTSTSERGLFS